MRYRGAVNYYSNLPGDPTEGDVWVVRYQGSSGQIPNGHAYCWDEAPTSTAPDAPLVLQWIDLGNLGEYLPSGIGKIYYNGVCYSSGGEGGKFFHREQPDVEPSNLIVLDGGTLTTSDSINYRENLLLFYNGNLSLNESLYDRVIYDNILNLSSANLTCTNLSSNLISVNGSTISINDMYYNFITGRGHYINVEAMYGSVIGGSSNVIRKPNGVTSGYYLYETIMLGYQNSLFSGAGTDAGYILLGSYNQIHKEYNFSEEGYLGSDSYYCIGIGYSNKLSGHENYGLGSYNNIGYSDGYLGYGSSNYSGAFGTENNIVYSNYSWILGRYNNIFNCSETFILGQNDRSISCSKNSLIGYGNIIEGYTVGTDSYGYTTYNRIYSSAIVGEDNHISANSSGNCNYIYVVGYHNNLTNINDVLVLGNYVEISNTNRAIRLGFYPLINDDFFAIGDGGNGARSSIIRIDSSKNIYLNSTVPTPPIPTTNGTYVLNVLNGASSWVSGGGGGSATLAGLTDVSLTTPTDGQILVYDSVNSIWVNSNNSGGGSNVPDKPLNDGNYKLTIESGAAAWTVISGGGSTNLPDVPLIDGVYQLDVTSGNPSWVSYTAPTEVVANPSGTASETLSKLQVGSTIYGISGGGGSSDTYSTTAHKVGTWINGQDVWEKTYVFTYTDFHNETISSSVQKGQLWLDIDSYDMMWLDQSASFQMNTQYTGTAVKSHPLNFASTSGAYTRANIQRTDTSNDGKPFVYYENTYSTPAWYNIIGDWRWVITVRWTEAITP